MNIETSRQTSRSVALIVTSALGVLMAVGVMVWWFWPFELGIGGDNTMEGMVTQIRTRGSWAALGSIMLMVAHSFLPFPSELITLANGMVFGPLRGSVITWVGAMLGALGTFAMVRWLGRPFVHRMLSENQLRHLTDWSARQGGMALLLGRLIPVISFNLLNDAAALTHISWWTFIWATGLGILPLTILLNVFGASMLNWTGSAWLWLLLGSTAILLIAAYAHSTRARGQKH